MIVGDPLQAIYSFRGGDSRFILNFDTDYKDVKVINLNTNYRCSKDIVFTSKLVDFMVKNYKVDKSRIYVMGFIDKNGCLYNKLSDMGKKWLLD